MAPVVLTWDGTEPLPASLSHAALADGGRPVIAVLGGASGMGPEDDVHIRDLLEQVVIPAAARSGAHVVSGGTDAGVSGRLGPAWSAAAARGELSGCLLVGVVPGGLYARGRARLQKQHTHVVLVPGAAWGAEVVPLARLVTRLAGGASSVTVLVNGGEISRRDVAASLAEQRPVLAAAGTGRLADELAVSPLTPGVHVLPRGGREAAAMLALYLG